MKHANPYPQLISGSCRVLACAALLVAAAARAGAQVVARTAVDSGSADAAPGPSCDGRTITGITINSERPPFSGASSKWRAAAHAVGLHHATTRPGVVRAYLLVKPGDICSDARIAESVRVLRDLPFLGEAVATLHPDSANGVSVDIRTTDEVPVLVTGSLRHSVPAALSLGNENVGGLGLRVVAGGERGDVYRGAAHVEVADFAPFNRPVFARVEAARDPLGDHVSTQLSHLFLSNFQRTSWQASFSAGNDYPIVVRPVGDNEAVQVYDQRWSASGVVRSDFGSTVALWGPVAIGTRATPSREAIVVTDSGPMPGDSALAARFTPFRSVRAGGLLGLRRVHYVTRTGLDALFASQDVITGWQVGGMVAPGVTSGGGHDVLFGNSTYIGASTSNIVLLGDLEAETRRDLTQKSWRSTIVNARAAGYLTPSSHFLIDVQDEFSSLGNAELPTQLSLGDPLGGARGYIGSSLVGGTRNVVRTEVRWANANVVHHADFGLALFADAANLWAGAVPFGVTTTRQSVGISLLSAYPSRSKRLYRLDLAIPLQRDRIAGRGRGIEIRFMNGDPTYNMSTEPDDVTRVRLAPIPASLFAWPGR